jgi:hypothetical protein
MQSPIKLNLKIYQGSTFTQVLRWESGTKIYVPIINITKSAPVSIIAPNHNIPLGWRARVTNIEGMPELVALGYQVVTEILFDTIEFNLVNSLSFKPYISGGVLEYNQPVPLDNLVARMQIREKVSSPVVLHELTTENDGIKFDTVNKTITIYIPDDATKQFKFTSGVYNLEFENTVTGDTITFSKGTITLEKEVSR